MRTSLRGALAAALLACCFALGVAAPSSAQETTGGASAASSGDSTSSSSEGTTSSSGSTTSSTESTTSSSSDDDAASTGTVSETTTLKLSRSQTKSVQRRVKVRADGAMGRKTRSAIKRYQRRKDLKATGRPNLETLRALKLKFGEKLAAKANRTASTEAPEQTAASAGDASAIIAAAKEAIGTPYGSGGNGPDSYDCSGLTVMAFKAGGITLPRTSFEQFEEGTSVERAAIQPGDLVFFDTAGDGASHVGIATSATTVISATTKGVMEHDIDDSYWGEHYVGARRVAG